ncbi:hypothetical protein F3J43_04720 [Pantoea sp. Cy-639]|nr:hypothetical protein [Pantoea sp. Cy-639]
MICQLALSFAGARNTRPPSLAGQRQRRQFEPAVSRMTTPTCNVMRGQVTGAVNHRIMRALYMEVRPWRTGIDLGCPNRSFGCPPLTTQECLV